LDLLSTISAMLEVEPDFFLVFRLELVLSKKALSRSEASESLLFMDVSKLVFPSFLALDRLLVIRFTVDGEVMSPLLCDESDSGVSPLRLALIILRTFFRAIWL